MRTLLGFLDVPVCRYLINGDSPEPRNDKILCKQFKANYERRRQKLLICSTVFVQFTKENIITWIKKLSCTNSSIFMKQLLLVRWCCDETSVYEGAARLYEKVSVRVERQTFLLASYFSKQQIIYEIEEKSCFLYSHFPGRTRKQK